MKINGLLLIILFHFMKRKSSIVYSFQFINKKNKIRKNSKYEHEGFQK